MRWVVVTVVSAGVLLVSGVVAARGVGDWEASLFRNINEVPQWVDAALWLPMQLGSAWAPLVVAGVAWWVTRSWRPTVGVLVAGWGGWWLAKGVKAVIDRGRPIAELGADAVRGSPISEGLGFVSGHATVAFACATVLEPYLTKPWRVFAYALATLVALSRVVIGAHLPLDALGGAALGIMVGALWHVAVGVDADRQPDRVKA